QIPIAIASRFFPQRHREVWELGSEIRALRFGGVIGIIAQASSICFLSFSNPMSWSPLSRPSGSFGAESASLSMYGNANKPWLYVIWNVLEPCHFGAPSAAGEQGVSII